MGLAEHYKSVIMEVEASENVMSVNAMKSKILRVVVLQNMAKFQLVQVRMIEENGSLQLLQDFFCILLQIEPKGLSCIFARVMNQKRVATRGRNSPKSTKRDFV